MNKIGAALKKYKHAWVLLYVFIYMPWFVYLERHVTTGYYIIHSSLDDKIPFVEYFIVPYCLWFIFIVVVVAYFFFTDVPGFYKLTTFLFTGMTIFLLISTVFPNGLMLRPTTFVRDNVFVDMVKMLYAADTSTNVFPSIHVFNSIGVCVAIAHSDKLKEYRGVQIASYCLAGLIILATMFLKQHSVVDVMGAIVMSLIMYQVVYVTETRKERRISRQMI
ncbi:phosphatase PAP2 family protein [Hespellia stercorisuis]|uniref:PAP2 superfamily protein n=1 Tax=Hespellia stercorisuis DSM 15480 TaxID=1121950 RepID=A0A1M6JL67_9FIRM|nr:phosphatase PAP2 family protein [Hespellia stercorisuis]SHJ47364.1 PAP2 superfamily protein [Hespellia stercorisuis DSM 15480]